MDTSFIWAALIALVIVSIYGIMSRRYNAIRKETDELMEEFIEATKPIMIRFEKIGSIVYAYDDNGRFYGQGTTKEELIKTIGKNRVDDRAILTTKTNLKEVGFE